MVVGTLVNLATFPGVVLHEIAHWKACEWRGVSVREVCLFRLGNPAGYVEHHEPSTYADTFWISVSPFLFNTLIAITLSIAYVAMPKIQALHPLLGVYYLLTGWIGLSAAMHAIPSKGDASNIWMHSKREWRNSIFAVLGGPIVGVIYAANLLRFLWIDVFYAIFIFLGTAEMWEMLTG